MPKKSKPTVVEILNPGEFDRTVDKIAALQVQVKALEAEHTAALHAVGEKHGPAITAIDDKIDALMSACNAYALANRDELFQRGMKQSETPTARFGFRLGNLTLKLLSKRFTWDTVISTLKADKLLARFVRLKEEVDKDGLKAAVTDAAQLARMGLRLDQDEAFWIEPKADGADRASVKAGEEGGAS